jgi:hypothetical protein
MMLRALSKIQPFFAINTRLLPKFSSRNRHPDELRRIRDIAIVSSKILNIIAN